MGAKPSKSESTKRAILEKALQLFQKKGFDSITMRELAANCDLSLGAFYYHFRSKEEIVLHLYQSSLTGHLERTEHYLAKGRPKLADTMKWICHDRWDEFRPYQSMLRALTQRLDPEDPISPWHSSSAPVRRKSVDLFEKVSLACLPGLDKKSARTIARGLWMHHLLILGYWCFDRSPHNRNSTKLLEQSARIWKILPTLIKVPGFKSALPLLLSPLQNIEAEK